MKYKFKSIKLWFFIYLLVSSLLLLIFGLMSDVVYAGQITFITGFFYTANVQSKKYNAKRH